MQDRYTGDVGDFGKYGLLRALAGVHPREDPPLQLGIVWYAVPDGGRDGDHRSYLDKPQEYKDCDPVLFTRMLAVQNTRAIAAVPRLGIFPGETRYFEEYVPQIGRADWYSRAMTQTQNCDLIFLDPDNGLRESDRPSPKHVLVDEVGPFVERGQSVILYHHPGRHTTHDAQITELRQRLGERFKREVIGLRYRRGTSRAFVIIPAPSHEPLLRHRLAAFRASPWFAHKHFIEP